MGCFSGAQPFHLAIVVNDPQNRRGPARRHRRDDRQHNLRPDRASISVLPGDRAWPGVWAIQLAVFTNSARRASANVADRHRRGPGRRGDRTAVEPRDIFRGRGAKAELRSSGDSPSTACPSGRRHQQHPPCASRPRTPRPIRHERSERSAGRQGLFSGPGFIVLNARLTPHGGRRPAAESARERQQHRELL